MSIRKLMILYFSCVMVVIFTLTELINGWQAYRQLEKNMTASVKELLNLSVKNMDYYFQDTSNVCLSIMADERTQNILQQEIGDDLDGKILGRELNKVVAQYASTRPYITKVYLMDKNRKIITPELRGEQVDKFLNITKNGKILNISPLHKAGYVSGTAKVFSVAKLIYAYNDRTEPLGTIVADIDCKVLEEAVGDYALPLDGRMILLNENGEVFLNKSGKDVQWENGSRKSSSEYVTISEQSQVTGWTLSAQIPRGEFIRSIIGQMWLSFAVLIFCLAVIVLVSRKIIHSVYQPLNLLTESMKTVEQGNFDTKIEYNQKDEFSRVIHGYNLMVVKIKALLQEIVEKEQTQRNAELYALQAQINSHFLYNTLNSIRYFAKIYKAPEIREITAALIQLSKASLSSEKFICIRQELELTEQYLAIQKMRYGDIAEVTMEMEEELGDCLIPRFSIQPAVENALFHGILPKGNGKIEVKVHRSGAGIEIQIRDDGVGIEKEQMEEINERLKMAVFSEEGTQEISRLKNIGLENINYRIRIYYGETEAGVRLEEENPGTRVEFYIPMRREE